MEQDASQINSKAITAIISREIKRNCILHVRPCVSKNYLALVHHVSNTRRSPLGSRAEQGGAGPGWAGDFSTAGRDSSAGTAGCATAPSPAPARAMASGTGTGTGNGIGPTALAISPPGWGVEQSAAERGGAGGGLALPVRYTRSMSCSAETPFSSVSRNCWCHCCAGCSLQQPDHRHQVPLTGATAAAWAPSITCRGEDRSFWAHSCCDREQGNTSGGQRASEHCYGCYTATCNLP